jgi:hypothetical protein
MTGAAQKRGRCALRQCWAAIVLAAFGVVSVPGAEGAGGARIAGRYRTFVEVVEVKHEVAAGLLGVHTTKTWTFIPRCSSGACVTTLLRPSIFPGKRPAFVYALGPVGVNEYRGRLDVADRCEIVHSDGRVSVLPYSTVDREVLTVHVTRVSAGEASGYKGTLVIRSVPLAAARAHGCTTVGYQLIEFRSPP